MIIDVKVPMLPTKFWRASIQLLLPLLKPQSPLLQKLPQLPLLLLHKIMPLCLLPPNWLPRPVLT